jgi:hypothetical protein
MHVPILYFRPKRVQRACLSLRVSARVAIFRIYEGLAADRTYMS